MTSLSRECRPGPEKQKKDAVAYKLTVFAAEDHFAREHSSALECTSFSGGLSYLAGAQRMKGLPITFSALSFHFFSRR